MLRAMEYEWPELKEMYAEGCQGRSILRPEVDVRKSGRIGQVASVYFS